MKSILMFACLLPLAACQRSFVLSGSQFSYHKTAAGMPPDTLMRRFYDGVYILKICAQKTKYDGHMITSFENCPDAPLDTGMLDKTIYLVFFEGNRVLYLSGGMLFATKRGVRTANNLRSFDIDLDSRKNRNRQLMRGYYYVAPPDKKHGLGDLATVHMQLEKYNRELVYLRFRYRNNGSLLLEEAGFSEKAEYDLNDFGPVMKDMDSVFHTKLEFFFFRTIAPNLVAQKPLWPPIGPTNQSAAVEAVHRALEW